MLFLAQAPINEFYPFLRQMRTRKCARARSFSLCVCVYEARQSQRIWQCRYQNRRHRCRHFDFYEIVSAFLIIIRFVAKSLLTTQDMLKAIADATTSKTLKIPQSSRQYTPVCAQHCRWNACNQWIWACTCHIHALHMNTKVHLAYEMCARQLRIVGIFRMLYLQQIFKMKWEMWSARQGEREND